MKSIELLRRWKLIIIQVIGNPLIVEKLIVCDAKEVSLGNYRVGRSARGLIRIVNL